MKTSDRANCSTGESIERQPLDFVDVVAIARIAEVVTAFVQGTTREIEEVRELCIRSSSESFRNIGGSGCDRQIESVRRNLDQS